MVNEMSRYGFQWGVLVGAAVLVAAGCGNSVDKKRDSPVNNATNNGSTNAGGSNNGATNNGATNNGATNNGATNNGATNNGATNNGPTNNGGTNNGGTNNGGTNNGGGCFVDADGDGYGDAQFDGDCSGDGYASRGGDCDDSDRSISPGETADACDGIDRDCSGAWAPSVPTVCTSIQIALDQAAAADFDGVVEVGPGTYREAIVFPGTGLTLRGAGAGSTTIDGTGKGTSTVTFPPGSADGFEGFTVTGGEGTTQSEEEACQGGGIFANDSSPTLRNLIVEGNEAYCGGVFDAYGGGISLFLSNAVVENVVVRDNYSARAGGGIATFNASPTLRWLRVYSNEADLDGGGLHVYGGNPVLTNSAFVDNLSGVGGGVHVQSTAVAFQNLHLSNNDAYDGSAFACRSCTGSLRSTNFAYNEGGGRVVETRGTSSLTISYSNFYQNDDVTLGVDVVQQGNISVAPALTSTAGDVATWDLTPLPNSGLIDAGDPTARDPDQSRADIGAHGGPDGDWPAAP